MARQAPDGCAELAPAGVEVALSGRLCVWRRLHSPDLCPTQTRPAHAGYVAHLELLAGDSRPAPGRARRDREPVDQHPPRSPALASSLRVREPGGLHASNALVWQRVAPSHRGGTPAARPTGPSLKGDHCRSLREGGHGTTPHVPPKVLFLPTDFSVSLSGMPSTQENPYEDYESA